MFRSWPDGLPPEVEVCAIELPGHETRFRERPFERLSSLVDALTSAVLPLLDRPFAIYGHSLGAVIGFAFARALRRRDLPGPLELFVAARRAPQLRETSQSWRLSDTEFLADVRRMGGIPDAVFQEPGLMARFLPILRADFAVVQAEAFTVEPPLDCPITAYGGVDDERASVEQLQDWQVQTSRRFELEMLPGGHFFLQSARTALLGSLGRHLSQILDR